MKEKLIIKNFGPIKSVELDLGRFTILIGEQATGKSTVAKVLAVCRYFSYIVWDKEITGDNESSFSEGLKEWGLNEYIQKLSYISYECKDYSLTVKYSPQNKVDVYNRDENGEEKEQLEVEVQVFAPVIIPVSEEFKTLLREVENFKNIDNSSGSGIIATSIPRSFFQKEVSSVMDNPFYLPTERGLQSLFSLGKNSTQNISDSLYNYFAKMDQITRSFKTETTIEPLNLVYQNRSGKGYIRKNDETKFFSLSIAASGYQSTVPVVLLIKHYVEREKKRKTFIIEEPELNLFPSAQNKLMQYLVDKTMNYGNSMLLTTQSPYIQTSLNNMIYAYQVGQLNTEKAAEIIDKKYWLNPQEVSAYRLLNDGTAKNILDNELMQIDAGEIDEVSRDINDKWDKLANVEYNKPNED